MSNRRFFCIMALACLAAAPAFAQATPTCGPLDNGRVADVVYKGTAIFFDPVVTYPYESAILTISGPCEDIVKTFKPGEQILFDLSEIQRVLDGGYNWELRFMPAVDPAVREALEASRGTGEEQAVWWSFWQKGAIPGDPSVDSANFSVVGGQILDPNAMTERSATLDGKASVGDAASSTAQAALASGVASAETPGGPVLAPKGTVLTNADGIIRNSLCVGSDCASNESFGFDTIRLKENNTRIQFNDTSSISGFPTNNWQIRANSSSSGGSSFLGFVDQGANGDSETGTAVFGVEASAPSHALWVENDGDVGFGTSNPVVRLHVVDTDSPALRLDQSSAGGFAPQVWDVAGNETNFFVRDATNGSHLPFRIRPSAPTSSIDIAASGNVGMGTSSPAEALHVRRTSGSANLELETTANAAVQMNMVNSGGEWQLIAGAGGALNYNRVGVAGTQFIFATNGNMTIQGTLTTGGPTCGGGCDLVLSPDYEVEPIERHAEEMWASSYLPAVGPTRPGAPMNLSEKTGGILNELEKAHIYIAQLNKSVRDLREELRQRDETMAALEKRLATMEARVAGDE